MRAQNDTPFQQAESYPMTEWEARMWARGFPLRVVDLEYPDGSVLVHYVHPPPRRRLAWCDRCRAIEANALVRSSHTEDVDELFARLERAEDLEAELLDLEVIRRIHDAVCDEWCPNAHFRNRYPSGERRALEGGR
jgi:hypothetical protein